MFLSEITHILKQHYSIIVRSILYVLFTIILHIFSTHLLAIFALQTFKDLYTYKQYLQFCISQKEASF